MKITTLALLSAMTLGVATSASADLLLVDDIPTDDVLVSRGDEAPFGSAGSQATFGYRNADAAGTDGTRGRGQSFTFDVTGGSATYDISSISVALSAGSTGNGTRPAGDLIVTVFEWDGANADDFTTWDAATGAQSGTELFNESFEIAANSSFLSTQLLQISLTTGELQLTEGESYGFFFRYVLDDVTGLTTDVAIGFDSDNGVADGGAGALLNTNVGASFAVADNGQSTSRDLNYFITGSVVPEPGSLALLGLGGLLIARRRRA